MMVPDKWLGLVAALQVDPRLTSDGDRVARFMAESGQSRPTYYRLRSQLATAGQPHRKTNGNETGRAGVWLTRCDSQPSSSSDSCLAPECVDPHPETRLNRAFSCFFLGIPHRVRLCRNPCFLGAIIHMGRHSRSAITAQGVCT